MRNFNGLSARGAALVTGASRGLGFEMAKKLSALGFDLVITGCDGEALSRAAEAIGGNVSAVTADLSVPGEAERLYAAATSGGREISVLINNAGLGASGEAWTVPAARDAEIISVNAASALILTKLFLKDAAKRGFGALCNVCSVGAFQPGPYTASYYASKSFLHSYTLACRYEAKKYGVTVTSLCPGPLDTDFFKYAGAAKPALSMSAEKAADYAVKRILKGRKTVVPGVLNRLARLVPAGVKTKVIAKMKRIQTQTDR